MKLCITSVDITTLTVLDYGASRIMIFHPQLLIVIVIHVCVKPLHHVIRMVSLICFHYLQNLTQAVNYEVSTDLLAHRAELLPMNTCSTSPIKS